MEENTQEQEQAPEQSKNVLDDLDSVQIDNEDFTPNNAELEREEKESVETKQLVLMAISPLFDIFAPNWGVADEEKDALAGAYAECLDLYFPDIEANPIIGAVLITGMIVAPRIGTPRVLKKDDEETEDLDSGD